MPWSDPHTRAIPAALVVGLTLAGCAGLVSASGAGQDSAAPTPTPTAACPVAQDQPTPTDCIPYDGEFSMQQNEAYRQRRELSDAERRDLEPRRQAAQDALAGVPAAELSAVAVTRSLEDAGFDEQQVTADESHIDDLTVVTVIVSVPGGCLVGSASDGGAEMDATGQIADGGCVTAPGH